MLKPRLPIGIQNFREMREDKHYYVDKTAYIAQLLSDAKHIFLARPRRFGKSLFIDTMKELFEGNEPLFKGLAIHPHWDWSVSYPIVRLSFASGNFASPDDLAENVSMQLKDIAASITDRIKHPIDHTHLGKLVQNLHEITKRRVVLLVDEYDKPILDNMTNRNIARANRDYLRGLYSIIKDYDAYIHFSFITGVSKFSKVNLFSGLNNLTDITIDSQYSSICGYTEKDLDRIFANEMIGLDRQQIRNWYNGYAWLGDEKVYNPFDILLLFRNRKFGFYWFETGTPTFLVDLLFSEKVSAVDIQDMLTSDELLSAFDIDRIAPEALLFQTGYLTITGIERHFDIDSYRLSYPNREVRQGLNRSLLRHMIGGIHADESQMVKLYDLLLGEDLHGVREQLHAFFASIPYEWFTKNNIVNYEGYYANVFYSLFTGLGFNVSVEDSTNRGRLDMAVQFKDRVLIFEFKVVEQAGKGSAIAQLHEKQYAQKFQRRDTRIYLIGVEFSKDTRNIIGFDIEKL